jgi:hypothetical protein
MITARKKKRGLFFRLGRALLGLLLGLVALIYFCIRPAVLGRSIQPIASWPRATHATEGARMLAWEDDVNNAAFVKELLEGYAKHDFPCAPSH